MFKELMIKVTEERNKLLDKCTKKLIDKTGSRVPDNANNFDMVVLLNDLKIKGYKIKHYYLNKDIIFLIKIDDMNETIEAGYEIIVEVEDNKVSIVAVELK